MGRVPTEKPRSCEMLMNILNGESSPGEAFRLPPLVRLPAEGTLENGRGDPSPTEWLGVAPENPKIGSKSAAIKLI